MQLTGLRALYHAHRQDLDYRCKEWTEERLLEDAKKSFNRLPDKQKEVVQNQWSKLLAANREPVTLETANELLRLRFVAQTNLFFLCKLLEKYNQVTESTHQGICNNFFVQKDPTFVTFDAFALQYPDLKKRMLLTPRGGFKSSIDIADCVQWIVCYPAVTILILTGVLQLARDFVGELRQHFTLEETGVSDSKGKMQYGPRKLVDKLSGEWSPSLFQVLFPEHCLKETDGRETEFQTPAGGDDKEPTVRAASIEQALSGMHFGILKLDDVVTNENSQTVTRLEAVNKQISINEAMLHPYGFFDVIGTWYDEQDFYGITIRQEEMFAKEHGMGNLRGTVDSGRFESHVYFKIYLRAAWWPTEEAVKQGKIEAEMTRTDWELWFAERLSYDFLLQKQQTDPYFAIKYLNNPRKHHQVKFPRELLIRRTLPHNQLPQQGFIVTTIDTAYSVQAWADFTVILTALIFGGRFYIINMVRGRFNEFELPTVIAAAGYKWKPKRIAIEDSVGVRWMSRELRREMDKLQISIPVEYVSLGFGNKKTNTKKLKAKPVVRLLGDERLYFLNSCEGLGEIYNELEKFTGTADDTHDDIVSALSLMAEQFGPYADMDQRINVASQQYVADRQSRERHDQIFGLGKYARYNAAGMGDHPATAYQLDRQAAEENLAEGDPFSELM